MEKSTKNHGKMWGLLQKYAGFRDLQGVIAILGRKVGIVMAKKKKRYLRRNRKQRRLQAQRSAYDRHHLCFIKRRWSNGSIYALRQFHYCIMPIPRATLHRYIHENIAHIPVPSELGAKAALEQLRYLEKYGAISDDDPLEKRLNLLAALFDCIDQPTADGFRTQLNLVRKFYEKPP